MKYLSPKTVIFFSSGIIAILTFVITLLLNYWTGGIFNFGGAVIITLLVFIISYLVLLITLERFIYRRIKLIYKNIYEFKSPKKEEEEEGKVKLERDVLSDVESDVLQWARTKKQEMEQLRKLEKYRKEFLANVAHELKTPVFNIQGYIETLLDNELQDEKINMNYLSRAAKNVERLNAIIMDLDMISQLESGEIKPYLEKFSIFSLIEDVLENLQVQARNKNITLSIKEGLQKNLRVLGEKDRIRQVLINLVSNSIRYGKEGGETQIGCYDMDENILIEVSDDGIGIAKEHLPRLFERFYRVDKNRSRQEGGTGLGLSIVKHIIESHNQAVNVRSTPGVGSTFGFTLKKASK